MSGPATKMTFHVVTRRRDAHGSVARCKAADITLDTDLAARADAFNPAGFKEGMKAGDDAVRQLGEDERVVDGHASANLQSKA